MLFVSAFLDMVSIEVSINLLTLNVTQGDHKICNSVDYIRIMKVVTFLCKVSTVVQ